MRTRILTALVGIPLVLVLLFWPGGIPWFIGLAAVMAIAIYEYTVTLRVKDIWVHWAAMAVFSAILLLMTAPDPVYDGFRGISGASDLLEVLRWQPRTGHVGPAFLIMALLIGDLVWKRRAPLTNVGTTLLGTAYIGLLFPFLALLRRVHGPVTVAQPPVEVGAWAVLSVMLVIWSVDSAAYFVGRAIGKHKCAPAISPNKTWEGVFGGLAAAAVAGAIVLFPLFGWLGAGMAPAARIGLGLAFGLIVGAMGIIGDLVKSAMKRQVGVKDFGALLPGHGGILDRFDSLLFAAPTAYVLITSLPQPPR
jgi:phosphatidate cytidylyltransferase